MRSIWAGGGGNQISPWDPLISHLLLENCLPFVFREKMSLERGKNRPHFRPNICNLLFAHHLICRLLNFFVKQRDKIMECNFGRCPRNP